MEKYLTLKDIDEAISTVSKVTAEELFVEYSKDYKFKVGDTVKILKDYDWKNQGLIGVICHISGNSTWNHGVDFGKKLATNQHDCEGHCPEKQGYYFPKEYLELAKAGEIQEETKQEPQVGDTVEIISDKGNYNELIPIGSIGKVVDISGSSYDVLFNCNVNGHITEFSQDGEDCWYCKKIHLKVIPPIKIAPAVKPKKKTKKELAAAAEAAHKELISFVAAPAPKMASPLTCNNCGRQEELFPCYLSDNYFKLFCKKCLESIKTKTCQGCGKEFYRYSSSSPFCSAACENSLYKDFNRIALMSIEKDLNSLGINTRIWLYQEAADFYTLANIARLYPDTKYLLEQKATELANNFENYLILACLGEARHAKPLLNETFKGIPAFIGKPARYTIWLKRAEIEDALGGKQATLAFLYNLFSKPGWGHNCGGENWQRIIYAVIMREVKQFTDVEFVDDAFALYHNGASVFNKIWEEKTMQLRFILELNLHEQYKEMFKYVSRQVATMVQALAYKPTNAKTGLKYFQF